MSFAIYVIYVCLVCHEQRNTLHNEGIYDLPVKLLAQQDKVDFEYNIRTKHAEAQELIAKNQKMQQEGVQSAMTKLRPKLQSIIDDIVNTSYYQ